MADVRLTATNPEDSSVVPVACDASGRLLLEEQGQGPPGPEGPPGPKGDDGKDGDPFSGNFADDVTFGGSALFAGDLNAGGFNSGVEEASGVILGYGGGVYSQLPLSDSGTGIVFQGMKGRGVSSKITSNGSAWFANGKAGFTEEGYLWCTTRRGDTVILDATSNGLASWADYTPPSRKQQIKERLDSIREDSGEMPADTQ